MGAKLAVCRTDVEPHHRRETVSDRRRGDHDSQNRLSGASQANSSGGVVNSYSYTYDPAGNRTSKVVNGVTTTYSYNGASQLSTQGATYDGAGNQTGGTGFSSLAYDAAGRTSSVTPSGSGATPLSYQSSSQNLLSGAGSTTLAYNSLGVASSTTSGSTTEYLRTPTGAVLGQHGPNGTVTPSTTTWVP